MASASQSRVFDKAISSSSSDSLPAPWRTDTLFPPTPQVSGPTQAPVSSATSLSVPVVSDTLSHAVSADQELPASPTATPTAPVKLSTLVRNNQKWESQRQDIHQFYIVEDHTLKETMDHFQATRRFKASERKWKEKLKEWRYEKNIRVSELAFMAAKSNKRKLEEGKDTLFYRYEKLVDGEKIEQFKKARLAYGGCGDADVPGTGPRAIGVSCWSLTPLATPSHVTYSTPAPESESLSPVIEDDDELHETLHDQLNPDRDFIIEIHQQMDYITERIKEARRSGQNNQRGEVESTYMNLLDSWYSESRPLDARVLGAVEEFSGYLSLSTGSHLRRSTPHCLELYEMVRSVRWRRSSHVDVSASVAKTLCQLLREHPSLPLKDLVSDAAEDILLLDNSTGSRDSSNQGRSDLRTAFCYNLKAVLTENAFVGEFRDFHHSFFAILFAWKLEQAIRSRFSSFGDRFQSSGDEGHIRDLKAITQQLGKEIKQSHQPAASMLLSVTTMEQLLDWDFTSIPKMKDWLRLFIAVSTALSMAFLERDEDIAHILLASLMTVDGSLIGYDFKVQLRGRYDSHLERLKSEQAELQDEVARLLEEVPSTVLDESNSTRVIAFGEQLERRPSETVGHGGEPPPLPNFKSAPGLETSSERQEKYHYPKAIDVEMIDPTRAIDVEKIDPTIPCQSLSWKPSFYMSSADLPARSSEKLLGSNRGASRSIISSEYSSHKYGSTYTDGSVISGISFNYSDLLK